MKPRKTRTARSITLLCAWAIVLGGCAYRYVISESLDQQVDRTLSFTLLQADPETHRGRLIPLGGMSLEARNLKEGTQIEVLHLPLDRYDRPVGQLTDSEGRFLVLHPGYLETAIFRSGRRITVVGEVTGKKVKLIDEVEYTYPYLTAKSIYIWPGVQEQAYYPSDPYPYYYPYWYPRSLYWYPWRLPVIIVPGDTVPPKKRQFDPGQSRSAPSSKGSKRGFQKSD